MVTQPFFFPGKPFFLNGQQKNKKYTRPEARVLVNISIGDVSLTFADAPNKLLESTFHPL